MLKNIFIALLLFLISTPLFSSEADLAAEKDVYFGFLSKKHFYQGSLISIGSLLLIDKDVSEHLFPFSNSDPSVDLRRMGDVGQKSGLVFAGLFGIQGIAFQNQKSRTTGLLSLESYLASGLSAAAIKFVIGRDRPHATTNPLKFGNHSTDSSFPSGHTTVAFAAATTVYEQYPHWYVGVPMYGAATALGFSRMYANKHWMSDVVGGAFLGTAVAHSIRRHHLRKKKPGDWAIYPDLDGIRFVKKF